MRLAELSRTQSSGETLDISVVHVVSRCDALFAPYVTYIQSLSLSDHSDSIHAIVPNILRIVQAHDLLPAILGEMMPFVFIHGDGNDDDNRKIGQPRRQDR